MARFNVIFLGDRRISQGALKVLLSDEFATDFCLKVIVTDLDFFRLAQKQLQLPNGIQFISNAARNYSDIQKAIEDNTINLLLSVQHKWILPGDILRALNGLAFNLHNSGLPEYKGYNSISHAIIDGVPEFRTTIHWMADEVDSGDIAFQGSVKIAETETSQSLYLKSVTVAVGIFHDLLKSLKRTDTPHIPMSGEGVFYHRKDLERMKDLTNVNDSVVLDRVIRASYFPPYAPAYKIVNGQKYYLVPVKAYDEMASEITAANLPDV